MPVYHAVVLALVQALTEFLPVSSSAHLILVPWLLGWQDHGLLFDIALHAGTVTAVIAYFFKTWVRLIFLAFGKEVWKPAPGESDYDLYQNPRLFWYLVAATIPAGLAGVALKDFVESSLRSPFVIGVMLIAIGLLIAYAERKGAFQRDLDRLTFGDAMAIGCAQAVALIPGTSRSGITISTAMLRGMTRHSAARFSFLLSTPIIVGAALLAAKDAFEHGGIPADQQTAFLVGVVVSAVAGFAVIAGFLAFLRRATMRVFVIYRVVFGIIVLALAYFYRFPAS
ncbi:MAG: undecaprenyl-diphosphate phosphatase [Acidobacteria bacterium]|nr:undecaprenyl-diphosphate phosphatase [Acidobacteriota bacterium]